MKILLVLIFIVIGIFNGFIALIAPGISASGSGCGKGCMENISSLETTSLIFLMLALITAFFPSEKNINKIVSKIKIYLARIKSGR
ncbi:hypothetical protein [Providencia alcalifaciens]|uniref:hypothetical protein n=1 Tax=Providencia alcalifaciens TaxID=126385 RepID=UPI00029BA775|nr:hypothetical protein [Providencia alcalifaciens]EKT65512.1 hypothetical protein OO9_11881 [Providencia alcalifaciens Dmel2]